MSTTSLPSYIAPSFTRTPSYSVEPHAYEQRLAQADGLRARPSGNFIKKSKNGDVRLRLNAQEDNITLPVYGSGGRVEGTIELSKTDGVTSVEVKIEGRLRLHEMGEGGMTTAKLCLDTALLWIKDPHNSVCPASHSFSLTLPSTFTYDDKTYPLPPTFFVKLSGLPGFTATIDYSVSATINRPNSVPHLVPLVKSKALGINLGATTVSTPFVYRSRTRPARPVPPSLFPAEHGFHVTSEWRTYESVLTMKNGSGQDITTKLHIPASRIFCMSQPIPFHLTLMSSAMSLAAYLPFGPTANVMSSRKVTRIQLMRQSTIDLTQKLVPGSARADIWRVDSIGEGSFKHAGDGPTWISFSGEIAVNDNLNVPGFRAAGLTVRDCILFTMTPLEPQRCPFMDLRQVIPVRLTTDPWTADGTGLGARNNAPSEYSIPSTPDEHHDDDHVLVL
ncbi:hypothetical protein BDQ12DRAFT_679993 [Crucibulum laeve]|uniref:Arrestin-like N-terminal domain-containing protein n=1 Tax=Crucibulum laeve TaxID=68775 RepID=A0A5C3M8K2_9AGAR|nr:hypothetical protein BDQ12DRAFT_679993 [Crucibulum laeve]